jgi:Oligoketide cyclase/lipid transport protein
MFELVADIERYPEFLPLCKKTVNRNRKSVAEGVETLFSTMTVGYKALLESFSTFVTLDHNKKQITCDYVDGPFKCLENKWTFRDNNGKCDVEFYIAYEFKNRVLGIVMSALFDKVFSKYTEAFEKRADELYKDQ